MSAHFLTTTGPKIRDWTDTASLCGCIGTIDGIPTLFGKIELVSHSTGLARLRRPTGEVGLVHTANFKVIKLAAGPRRHEPKAHQTKTNLKKYDALASELCL